MRRSNQKAFCLDVSQQTGQNDFQPFSPLEAIQVQETRYIRHISAYSQLGKTGYNLVHFVGLLVEIQAMFLSCNESLVLKMNGKRRGETRDTLQLM